MSQLKGTPTPNEHRRQVVLHKEQEELHQKIEDAVLAAIGRIELPIQFINPWTLDSTGEEDSELGVGLLLDEDGDPVILTDWSNELAIDQQNPYCLLTILDNLEEGHYYHGIR